MGDYSGQIGEINNTLTKVGSGYRSAKRGDYLLKKDGTLWAVGENVGFLGAPNTSDDPASSKPR